MTTPLDTKTVDQSTNQEHARVGGLTFLEALATRRPMRRNSGSYSPPWIHLGTSPSSFRSNGTGLPQWRRIDTGEPTGLARFDYEATDWEVMP